MIDPRILQANERTFLAYVRASLGIVAFGFVVAKLGIWLRATAPEEAWTWSVVLGTAFILFGMGTNVVALIRFQRARRAILAGEQIPTSGAWPTSIAISLTILAGILLAYLLAR